MIGKDFKYKIIKNILTKNECDILKRYHVLQLRHNQNIFDPTTSNSPNLGVYADYLGESILLNKHKLIEQESGLELIPTYSYWRMYTYGSNLLKHKDRPSCEISCTINVANSGESWPIYMEGTPLHLEPGDGAIYLGCELKHWRDDFKGDFSSNLFLHYVNKNGNNTEYARDKRLWYGMEKPKK